MSSLAYAGFLSELRMRSDIVSIVSETVRLKKSGNKYIGLCPFHNEKTPSFNVSPDVGLYHCFGCKAGGDVINFVMETERLEFKDAVKLLADKANMRVPDRDIDDGAERERRTERDRILTLNKNAAQYFHSLLWTDEGKPILDYFHTRGLDDAAIKRFGLGASPASGSAILDALASGEDGALLMVKAGLAIRKEESVYYGFFRSRAMFPIITARGEVIAFGGRAIGDARPKYLNTGETPVFNKRFNVYGANFLRKERNLSRVILVEGYMDALSLMNRGITGVAATLGTSLTSEQVGLLKRYAPEIWIAYDADEAGQKAALRAVDICEAENVRPRVIQFPSGKDPDEYIRSIESNECAAKFTSLPRLTPARFRLKRLKMDFDMADDEQRMRYAIEAGKILYLVKEPVELEDLLTRLAIETGYSKETLKSQVQKSEGDMAENGNPRLLRRPSQPEEGGLREPWPPRSMAVIEPMTETDRAARELMSLIARRKTGDLVKPDDFPRNDHQIIARMLLSGHTFADVMSDTEKDEDMRKETSEINGILTLVPPPQDEDIPKMINEILDVFKRDKIGKKVADTINKIKQGIDSEKKKELLYQVQDSLKASKRA